FVRTCVGCRGRASASELLRVVAVAHSEPGSVTAGDAAQAVDIVPDPRRRRPGRGAHIHPDPNCLALAERRRAFGRALRVAGVPDTTPLRQYLSGLRGSELPMVGPPTPDSKVGQPK